MVQKVHLKKVEPKGVSQAKIKAFQRGWRRETACCIWHHPHAVCSPGVYKIRKVVDTITKGYTLSSHLCNVP